jgi:hypothetical protein
MISSMRRLKRAGSNKHMLLLQLAPSAQPAAEPIVGEALLLLVVVVVVLLLGVLPVPLLLCPVLSCWCVQQITGVQTAPAGRVAVREEFDDV